MIKANSKGFAFFVFIILREKNFSKLDDDWTWSGLHLGREKI
jgi:hypothetical protein